MRLGSIGHGAHPRSRGENAAGVIAAFVAGGSSPLTRGKQLRGWRRKGLDGLIPAHAGKTSIERINKCGHWAHPRSRGENLTPAGRLIIDGGSSPLTRGKLWHGASVRRFGGLIPAHAGKTRLSMWITIPGRAHPRSRGENAYQSRARDIFKGSSPLTRGKHIAENLRRTRRGLIPAHAGKTLMPSQTLVTIWAHPRSRGENDKASSILGSLAGSSPLTRGKHGRRHQDHQAHRLIPAHAGKTSKRGHRAEYARAHPRSRGENALDFNPLHTLGGSSPLTRGKRTCTGTGFPVGGLIPAHAGKTPSP